MSDYKGSSRERVAGSNPSQTEGSKRSPEHQKLHSSPQYIPPGGGVNPGSSVSTFTLITIFFLFILTVMTGFSAYLSLTTRQTVDEKLAGVDERMEQLSRRFNDEVREQPVAENEPISYELPQKEPAPAPTPAKTVSRPSRVKEIPKEAKSPQPVPTVSTETESEEAVFGYENPKPLGKRSPWSEEINGLQEEAAPNGSSQNTNPADTQRDLQETPEALAGEREELDELIATNREELMALARRTARDYFEFALAKKGARQKIGTVVLELRKADLKRNLYTARITYDGKWAEERNKMVNEPVYFYPSGATGPLEFVVLKIGPNGISGYLSTPAGFFPPSKK